MATQDKIDRLKENLGQALQSLLKQKGTLLYRHKSERDDINAEIKKVKDNISRANQYHTHTP